MSGPGTGLPRRPLAAVVAGLLVSAVVLSPGILTDGQTQAFTDVAQLVAAAVAALAAASAGGRTHGRSRWTWVSVTVACTAWAAGEAVWTWYELGRGIDTPFPSLADVGFLGFPLAAGAALLTYPGRGGHLARGRRVLDAAIATSALAVVFWQTAVSAVIDAGSDNGLQLGVALAYPFSDFLLLVLLVLTVSSARGPRLLLAGGVAALCVSDSAFAYFSSAGTYDGGLLDLGWIAGFALLGLAALTVGAADPIETEQPTTTRDLLPYLPVALSSLVVVGQLAVGRPPTPAQTGLIALVVALVLLRQYLMLHENGDLARQLAAREEQLRHQAFHDDLTGLANRSLFQNRLEHALDLHGRDLRQVSVLYLDIDDFKVVNDTLGHAAGDELLVRVSERLLAALRTGDTVARVGGDEFAALLEDGGDPVTAAAGVAAALRPPFVLRGSQVRVGASIGVVALEPSDAVTTADSLLAQADTAMYDAKRRGKGQLSVYRNGMALPEIADTRTAAGLEGALSDGELRLVYQPVMALSDGRIDCLEALSRWLHEGRHVEPADFLPAAVRTGVVADLTEWALSEACHQAATWSHAMRTPVSVGVNVAGPQIVDPSFVAIVDGVLGRHGVQPHQLVLDVTEASLSANPEAAARVVTALRATGVRVAVDDFGIGPSSISLLHEVGVDIVKIDRSVIGHLDTDAVTVPFVRSLVQLGESLGLQVIAEGIERPEQLDMLLDLGCRLGQGHLLARPMDAVAVLEALVARGSAARRT